MTRRRRAHVQCASTEQADWTMRNERCVTCRQLDAAFSRTATNCSSNEFRCVACDWKTSPLRWIVGLMDVPANNLPCGVLWSPPPFHVSSLRVSRIHHVSKSNYSQNLAKIFVRVELLTICCFTVGPKEIFWDAPSLVTYYSPSVVASLVGTWLALDSI